MHIFLAFELSFWDGAFEITTDSLRVPIFQVKFRIFVLFVLELGLQTLFCRHLRVGAHSRGRELSLSHKVALEEASL
jgi:hypothetical protein